MKSDLLLAHFNRVCQAPDAMDRLRNFVLDLAVQGKLIEQVPTDESASALVETIQVRKASLGIEAGDVELVPPNEQPFEIPNNWLWVRLGSICLKTGSGSTPRGGKSVYQRDGVRFLRSQNIHNDGLRLDEVAYITPDTHLRMSGTALKAGDLLLNITGGSIGRCCVVPSGTGDANVSQHVAIIRLAIDGMAAYLHQLVLSPYFQSFIISEQTGAGRGGLPKNRMDRIPVVLPPLADQLRIVAKVRELMALCTQLQAAYEKRVEQRVEFTTATTQHLIRGRTQEEFERQAKFYVQHLSELTEHPLQIPILRQTILNLAVRGLLDTQQMADEPADRFLGSRVVSLEPQREPWKLPQGWAWSSFRCLGEMLGGGTPSKSDPDLWTGCIPWISPKDMKVDEISDGQDHISELALEKSAARLIPPGSLLVVVRGMILAHSFPAAVTSVPVAINQDMKALVPFLPELNQFLLLMTKGLKPEVLRLVRRSTHGTCKLLTEDLFSLPLPIPPRAEQLRIVDKVGQLMNLCNRLETDLSATEKRKSTLLESILHQSLAHSEDQNDSHQGTRQAMPISATI